MVTSLFLFSPHTKSYKFWRAQTFSLPFHQSAVVSAETKRLTLLLRSAYPGSQRKCDKWSGEERENRQIENRFELGSRSDPASWLEESYRCVVIGGLLIDLVMLIDAYRSMIVRFTSPATRGFLSPLLSLSNCLSLRGERKPWDQDTVNLFMPRLVVQ